MPSASNLATNKIMWTLVILRTTSLFVPCVRVFVREHLDEIIAFELIRGVVFEWVRVKLYSKQGVLSVHSDSVTPRHGT